MKKNHNSSVAVVIAALNEEEGIGPTIEELQKFLVDPHLLVIDGWSADRTVEIAKNMGADILLQEREGKGNAIGQAVNQMDLSTRFVVFIDADFTYPAEYIPKMIEVLEQNPDVGMVIGNRFNDKLSYGRAMSNVFYIGNRFLALAQHLVNGIKLDDPLSGLRIVRSDILEGWKPRSEGFDVEAEMNYQVERRGYQITEIPIVYRPRLGKKKLKLKHGLIILRRILVESIR